MKSGQRLSCACQGVRRSLMMLGQGSCCSGALGCASAWLQVRQAVCCLTTQDAQHIKVGGNLCTACRNPSACDHVSQQLCSCHVCCTRSEGPSSTTNCCVCLWASLAHINFSRLVQNDSCHCTSVAVRPHGLF